MTTIIANRLQISAIAQQANAESARQDGDDNTLWQTAWSMTASINSRLASADSAPNTDPSLLDIDMHDLWHAYWHGAINTAPNSPKLDRLALAVIHAREQGPTLATTSDGARIWTDLPFLAQDMTSHWIRDCAALGSARRLSGAQFLALLAAAGAAPGDALCRVALIVLREALETARPLGRLKLGVAVVDDGDVHVAPARQMRNLSVADLLPAANAWLLTAGRKLVHLSDHAGERGVSCQFPDEVGRLGELVVANPAASSDGEDSMLEAGESPPRHGGFSPQRWMWWLRRLEQIAALATQDGHHGGDVEEEDGPSSLASFVQGMIGNMLAVGEQTSGAVGQALQRSGGRRRHHQPVVQLLGPDRAATP